VRSSESPGRTSRSSLAGSSGSPHFQERPTVHSITSFEEAAAGRRLLQEFRRTDSAGRCEGALCRPHQFRWQRLDQPPLPMVDPHGAPRTTFPLAWPCSRGWHSCRHRVHQRGETALQCLRRHGEVQDRSPLARQCQRRGSSVWPQQPESGPRKEGLARMERQSAGLTDTASIFTSLLQATAPGRHQHPLPQVGALCQARGDDSNEGDSNEGEVPQADAPTRVTTLCHFGSGRG
jgi:hypothetical protein